MKLHSASLLLWASAGSAAEEHPGKGRRALSWIANGDGAYDCLHAHLDNPCEGVAGPNLLPLPPYCKTYMLCADHQLAELFACSDGDAFDHGAKECVREELADCPCTVAKTRSFDVDNTVGASASDGMAPRQYDTKTAKAGVAASSKSGKQAKVGKSSSGSSKSAKSKTSKVLFADTVADPPAPMKEEEQVSSSLIKDDVDAPCAPVFDPSIEYEKGDVVSLVTDMNSPGVYFEHLCHPRDPDTTCGHIIWDNSWILTGECHGEVEGSSSEESDSPSEEPEVEVVDEMAAFSAQVIPPSVLSGPTASELVLADESEEPPPCIAAPAYRDFESGIFPTSQWRTGGHGNWAIDEGNTYQGRYSIKSPDLSGAEAFPAVSKATLTTCDDFAGGSMTLGLKASVLPPTDVFAIYIDGANGVQYLDVREWTEVTIDIPPGRHVIDFSYMYNVFSVDSLPPPHSGVEGAVWIDDILLEETAPQSSNFLARPSGRNKEANPADRLRWSFLGLCGAGLLLACSVA